MNATWMQYFQGKLDAILAELKQYVEMESPTHNKKLVDQLGHFIMERFRLLGCKVSTHSQREYGDQIRVEYGEGEEQILILGHFDTVKEVGTLKTEPWRIEAGKLYGPGVFDMKAGIVFSYFALQTIIEQGLPANKRLVFFWNTDEEAGSPSSLELIKKEARKSKLALVIEPAFGDGYVKTSRKGGGEFSVQVKGRAAHAGNHHEDGVNAIEEMAHQILAIQSWTDYEAGTTVSVGTIKGGTVSNVIPEYAEVDVDFRVSQAAEADKLIAKMNQLKPTLCGATVNTRLTSLKPPMERTEETERLFFHAKAQALQEGFELREIGVGGTSDGNFTAAVGTPTLDGLGPVGDGAHASHEHILVDHIAPRTALLLRLFTTL